jgi:ribosome-binding ATPase YchF (GTP1/OBG family)
LSSQEPVLVVLVRIPLKGRDDVVRDGDILYFRFSV